MSEALLIKEEVFQMSYLNEGQCKTDKDVMVFGNTRFFFIRIDIFQPSLKPILIFEDFSLKIFLNYS